MLGKANYAPQSRARLAVLVDAHELDRVGTVPRLCAFHLAVPVEVPTLARTSCSRH